MVARILYPFYKNGPTGHAWGLVVAAVPELVVLPTCSPDPLTSIFVKTLSPQHANFAWKLRSHVRTKCLISTLFSRTSHSHLLWFSLQRPPAAQITKRNAIKWTKNLSPQNAYAVQNLSPKPSNKHVSCACQWVQTAVSPKSAMRPHLFSSPTHSA